FVRSVARLFREDVTPFTVEVTDPPFSAEVSPLVRAVTRSVRVVVALVRVVVTSVNRVFRSATSVVSRFVTPVSAGLAVSPTSLMVSVRSVMTLCSVLVRSVTRLCRALATPLTVLAALLTVGLVVAAAGVADAAFNVLVIADRLPRAGAVDRLPRAGTVDETVRSSNTSSPNDRHRPTVRHGRRFSGRLHVRVRNSLRRILDAPFRKVDGFPCRTRWPPLRGLDRAGDRRPGYPLGLVVLSPAARETRRSTES